CTCVHNRLRVPGDLGEPAFHTAAVNVPVVSAPKSFNEVARAAETKSVVSPLPTTSPRIEAVPAGKPSTIASAQGQHGSTPYIPVPSSPSKTPVTPAPLPPAPLPAI